MANIIDSLAKLIPQQVQNVVKQAPIAVAVKTLTPYVNSILSTATQAGQQTANAVKTAAAPKPQQIVSPIPSVGTTASNVFDTMAEAQAYARKQTGMQRIEQIGPNQFRVVPYTEPPKQRATPPQQQQQQGGGGKADQASAKGQVRGVSIKMTDINPLTGKAYGINPETGVMDEGYFNYLVRLMSENNIPLSTIQAMQKYSPANINVADIEAEELKKATPYYERLLRESNWDFDQALKKMEEEYAMNVRNERYARDVERKTLATITAPEEYMQKIDELARRGLLTTIEGTRTPLEMQMSTGENIQAVTPMAPMQYGGIAGRILQPLLASQQARAEAIQKAQQSKEEELEIPYRYNKASYEEQKKRKAAELEQQKRKEVAASTAAAEQRARDLAAQKVSGLLQPYL